MIGDKRKAMAEKIGNAVENLPGQINEAVNAAGAALNSLGKSAVALIVLVVLAVAVSTVALFVSVKGARA